jgi:hypothetical protein
VIQLNSTALYNTIPFNYYPPAILSLSPTSRFGIFQLDVMGLEFGPISSEATVTLRSTSTLVSTVCNIPTWKSSTKLSCTAPSLTAGDYNVLVTVGGQTSSQTIVLTIL